MSYSVSSRPTRSMPALIAVLILCGAALAPQTSSAQKSSPTSAANPEPQKPTKPDESSSAASSLVQLNNALEGLAAKVSPAVVQILVTSYAPAHEQDRTQSALIVRQHAVGSG